MRKLHKVREWLNMPQAARFLSETLKEPVEEEDLFTMGVEGKLTLSVILVAGVAQAHRFVDAGDDAQPWEPRWVAEHSDSFVPLNEIYDLDFRLEHRFDVLNKKSVPTDRSLPFSLRRTEDDGQEYFIDFRQDLPDEALPHPPATADTMLFRLGLPESCQLVVKTIELNECLARLMADPTGQPSDTTLSKKERGNLHNIIGGLLQLLLEGGKHGTGKPPYSKQELIIKDLIADHKNVGGMSARNLEDVFAKARKSRSGD